MKTTSGEPFDKKSIFHSLTPLLPMGHSEFMHEFWEGTIFIPFAIFRQCLRWLAPRNPAVRYFSISTFHLRLGYPVSSVRFSATLHFHYHQVNGCEQSSKLTLSPTRSIFGFFFMRPERRQRRLIANCLNCYRLSRELTFPARRHLHLHLPRQRWPSTVCSLLGHTGTEKSIGQSDGAKDKKMAITGRQQQIMLFNNQISHAALSSAKWEDHKGKGLPLQH